ncbi:hypothetical protein Tco_0608825 [Tanacetum coccineum]
MVPYEAFACPCGSGDVVLRESYKPKTRGKILLCSHDQSLSKTLSDVNFFYWKAERVRLLVGSPGASMTSIYSPGPSRNAECSNCNHLLDKITVLEATVEMYMNLEQHTVNPATLLHEVYNDMGKLDFE